MWRPVAAERGRWVWSSGRLALVLGAWALFACTPEPSVDDETLRALLEAAADGDCPRVLAISDAGFRVDTVERADAANVAIGKCEYRTDLFDAAIAQLSEAAGRAVPNAYTPQAAYYLARSQQRGGYPEAAERGFTHLEERFSNTRYFDDGLYHHGRVFLALALPDEANERFLRLAQLDTIDGRMLAKATYGQGRAAELEGDLQTDPTLAPQFYERAIAVYAAVVDEHPTSSIADNALYRTGRVQRKRGMFADAVAAFDRLIDEHPASGLRPVTEYQRGRALLEAGDDVDAAAAFTAFIEAYPGHAFEDNARYRLGRSLYAQGRKASGVLQANALFAQADQTLGELVEIMPRSNFVPAALYYAGRARYRSDDFAGAAERFSAVLDRGMTPYEDNASYYLGMSLYRQASTVDEYAEAIAWFESVVSAFPTSIFVDNAAYFRARAMVDAGDLMAGADALRAFAGDYPDSVFADNALYYRVLALVDVPDCDAARDTFRWLQYVHPSSIFVSPAQVALETSCPEAP